MQARPILHVPLIGVPRARLLALADALAQGPIDTALLQSLLEGGLPGTPLGTALSEWLAARCALPACSQDEAAAWRCVLQYALHLPQAHWEVECMAERPRLHAATAARDPLLQYLHDALYRPLEVAPGAWQSHLAAQRGQQAGTDARQLARQHQRSRFLGQDTPARHASMAAQLAQLAPDASPQTLQRALHCIRQHEQRDAGLLDLRAGLPVVFSEARDAASMAAIRQRLAALQRGTAEVQFQAPTAAPALAVALLEVAREASVDLPACVQPLGRYDSASRALVSLLSAPFQLQHLLKTGFDLSFAAASGAALLDGTSLPRPDAVANAAQPLGQGGAWAGPVDAVVCTPVAGHPGLADHGRALLGRQRPSTAIAVPGQCWEQRHRVPGMLREQAAAIGDFLAAQPSGPAAATVAEDRHPAPLDLVRWQQAALAPCAAAGALTDLGIPVSSASPSAGVFNGAAAQAMVPVQGRLPLPLLAPLIDRLAPGDWWDTLDWQVPRTPGGLHAAVNDAFAQAGLDLQHRAPDPEALAAFFDSPPLRAWYAALQRLPMLPEDARRDLADGGNLARAYAFTRMLELLTHTARATGERRALHGLAGIGRATATFLQAQEPGVVADAQAHFDALAWTTDTVAGRLAIPLTEAQLQAHRTRMHQAYGWPLPHGASVADMRAWLVQAQPALLDETGFNLLDRADTLLADLLVTLRRDLDPLRFGAGWVWRGKAPTAADWRDHLERKAAVTGTHWVTELGALFHRIAASLARYEDLEPPPQSLIDPRRNDLRVLTGALIAPVLHLYAGVDLPMAQADPWYRRAYPAFSGFFAWTGGARASSALARLEALDLANTPERLRPLLRPMTVTLPLPAAVLQHLLGRDRIADDPQQQARDLLRLQRGGESLQLVAQAVEISVDEVTPELVHGFYRQLAAAPGADALGIWRDRFQRGSIWQLSPDEWLTLLPDSALAALWRAPGMRSNREGVVHTVKHAIAITADARTSAPMPTLWTRIMDAPQALDLWCASDDAQQLVWQRLLGSVAGRSAGSRLDRQTPLSASTCAALLGASAEAQLAVPGVRWDVPGDPAVDSAPVLSLAIELRARHPALTVDEALAFGAALLPPALRAAPAPRAPLSFPVLPQGSTSDAGAHNPDDAALPEFALRAPPERPHAAGPHAVELPPLDDLLEQFGLSLLHPDEHDGSDAEPLTAPDAWALMSRTRQFAEVCRPLLAEAGWLGGDGEPEVSMRGAQTLLAQRMLERYIGRARIDGFRERFAAPAVVEVPVIQLVHELRASILDTNINASPAALEVMYWLLTSELDQPALQVGGVPDWLTYGRSLQSVALRHGATLLEAMQPGACSRVGFDAVCALPAQLAQPAIPPGGHDDLHAIWARALVPAALAYATAHGGIGNLTRFEAATGQQMADALVLLKADQDAHAVHVQQLASPPPQRMAIAAQTLREAGVEEALWSQRPADIGDARLARHGIVPSRLLGYALHLYGLDTPDGPGAGVAGDPRPRAVVTNNDTLQALVVADAWVSTNGPTTASRFESAFDAWQRTVETGLAGLIGTVLDGLPAADRQLIERAECTPLRVGCDERQADHGLLLRCRPPEPGAEPVHFEIIPQAGVARRVWQADALGTLVDFNGLFDGAVQRRRDGDQLTPLAGLTLTPYSVTVAGDGVRTYPRVATAAAAHLWQARLDQARTDELGHLTGLEERRQQELHRLNLLAEALAPFYQCVEELRAGELSAGTLFGCAMDAASMLVPLNEFLATTVCMVRTAGERGIQSIAAEAGSALQALGTSLVMAGGVGTVRDVAKGSLWFGSHAWNLALQGAEWLKQVLRSSPTAERTALAFEQALASGGVPEADLQARRALTPSLAEARLSDGRTVLAMARGRAWHRYDVYSGQPYGPALEAFTLEHGLPPSLPVTRSENGLQVAIGDTPAQFLDHGRDDWEVVIRDQHYRLTTAGDAFERIDKPEDRGLAGRWREVPVRCRPRRSLEAIPCVLQSRLRFVPDAAKDLQTDALRPARLQGIAAASREFTLDLAHTAPEGEGPLRLMVHKGQVCSYTPGPKTPQLVPVPAAVREALGLPASVMYPATLQGTLADARTFGLPGSLADADIDRLQQRLPVVDVGALVKGIDDARRLRAIRIESPFQRALCIEPDDGVFYHAALPASEDAGTSLHFTRLEPGRDDTEINEFLRASETYRVQLLRPYLEQDRENIARLVFGYIQPTLSPELAERFPTYEAYVSWFADRGRPDVLGRYADKVLTGQSEQRTFLRLARQRVPDWKALGSASEEERASVAEFLNALLPATGGKGAWSGIDAAALALPEAGRPILDHLKGANLAFAEVVESDGTRTIYYALSGGKRARNIHLRTNPSLPDGTRFVDARAAMQGVAPLPEITSLPVLRHADDTRTLVFDRSVDSERLIASCMGTHRNVVSFRLSTILGACPSCGGVVIPQMREVFPDAQTFSVRYLEEYGTPSPASIEPALPEAVHTVPSPELLTFFRQWRQDRGLS
ncbi:hypothetical protein BAY15_1639 [Stenotrophomonas rhizophila]|nr:hypothetical protein BAY15_1639 [Stenotrophomonas rhizophila]